MSAGHTPGPWVTYDDSAPDYEKWVVGDDASRHGQICVVESCDRSEADARLIAAAPDYDAAAREAIAHNTDARNIKDETGWVAITCEAYDMLRAAIAKAEESTR